MSSLNKVMLIGRLGKDPEIRHTQQGMPIANLSIATSEQWKGKDGERKEKTEWHRVVIYNEKLCELAEQYLKKGSQVYLEGQIQTRKYEDKDGNERWVTEIILGNFGGVMRFLSKASGDSEDTPPSQRSSKTATKAKDDKPAKDDGYTGDLDDEVPF